MSNGHFCANVPVGTIACDHLFEVAQPTATWGSTFILSNVPDRPSGTLYRILGATDGTQVSLDGVPTGTVDRGAFLELGPLAGDHLLQSSEPTFAVSDSRPTSKRRIR